MRTRTISDQSAFLANQPDPSQLMPWDYLEPEPDYQSERAEALQQMFSIIFTKAHPGSSDTFEVAWRRFIALSWVIRPDVFNGMTQLTIARFLGCTSANLSKIAMSLQDQLGIRGVMSSSDETRRKKSEAHLGLTKTSTASPEPSAEAKHKMAVHRACQKARESISTSKPWTSQQRQKYVEKGFVVISSDGALFLTQKGKDNEITLPVSKPFTKFQRLALWEEGYFDDDEKLTEKGKAFFNAEVITA